ncbi:heat-inducible transcriptional repressor HrcA [Ruminococcaceae bacterium OttesenSCG-928-A16]|nr:heat-inducible transcriptional repressor HrcA [Ruminococcaceae bacterium OttesenSCG-928-A16]
MPMDDRKQRILMAIVSLYASDAEPVGSNLLSQYFNMAVSSATLRNEMAALTRLGLLEQPHTSAGRVPTAKGYRYYVDNLLDMPSNLPPAEKEKVDEIFRGLDYDPEKLAQGAAKALANMLGYAVVVTTPRAEDMRIAHFAVLQVGRYTAAVLAVTNAGGVRTRVAKVDFELDETDIARTAAALNRSLRFVAEADINAYTVRSLVDSLGENGGRCWPIVSAALTLLAEAGTPSTYFEGQQYLLQWPELEPNLKGLVELFTSPERLQEVIVPHSIHTTVMFGDELDEPIPGLCVVSRRYLAGGGLTGTIAVGGPTRMLLKEVIPLLEYFSEQLGKSMSGSGL